MAIPYLKFSPKMLRRHFLHGLAGSSAIAAPAWTLISSLQANAAEVRKNKKALIVLWMGGGPATIDMWDMKPGSATGGPFQPISTSADVQICEHLPLMAKQMHHMAIVRSMSTREADHTRGRYYMHTGFVPNPNVEHPSYGALVAQQLEQTRSDLEIPPFISVGGNSIGPGFLGMGYAPFAVDSNGRIRNLKMETEKNRFKGRMELLDRMESRFIGQGRGDAPEEHAKILKKTEQLLTSEQMGAFQVTQEPENVQEIYGNTDFGRGCLLARRLVEAGVPIVEVELGGWDTHNNNFTRLETKLPEMDQAMAALVADLSDRGMLDDVAILWLGEFGRTPRINGSTGRDHWARSWSAVVGGAGFKRGIAVGGTSQDGTEVVTTPYSSEDLMASVLKSIGIPLDIRFTATNGRPMKIAAGGRPIDELLA